MIFRRLLGPGLIVGTLLAVLLALGVWQLQRRTWKLGLLAQIDAGEAEPPAPLAAGVAPPPFRKVVAHGVFSPGLAATYGVDVHDLRGAPVLGADVLAPLIQDDGTALIVDRGWAPQGTPPGDPPASPRVPAEVTGYVRAADRPGWFVPADEPAKRTFYTLDAARIGAALGLGRVAPFVLVALGPSVAGQIPEPAHSLPRPPNDHLNYAITWFALAATLAGVFYVYARKVLRR